MLYEDIIDWIQKKFCYPVPEDYLLFIREGDFKSILRKNYIIDKEEGSVLEISEWFTFDDIPKVYKNCLNENMIEKYHLPIFDSCGCTVVIDCNYKGNFYGQIFLRTPTGYYDEKLQENIYLELDFVAINFSEIINNLKTNEELEEMGL